MCLSQVYNPGMCLSQVCTMEVSPLRCVPWGYPSQVCITRVYASQVCITRVYSSQVCYTRVGVPVVCYTRVGVPYGVLHPGIPQVWENIPGVYLRFGRITPGLYLHLWEKQGEYGPFYLHPLGERRRMWPVLFPSFGRM